MQKPSLSDALPKSFFLCIFEIVYMNVFCIDNLIEMVMIMIMMVK
jgi:hypothetical protein